MLGAILKWGVIIALFAIIITNPAGAGGFIVDVFQGIVTFFRTIIEGIMSAF